MMEVSFLLFILLALIIFILSILFGPTKQNSQNKLPPGRTGWPIIGETLEFVSTGLKGIPEKFFNDRMSKYSPQIFKTSLLGEPMVVLCGASGHKFLFSNDNKLFTSWLPSVYDKIAPSLAANSSPSDHQTIKVKKMVAEFLKPKALKNYVEIMDEVARQHLETSWDGKGQLSVLPLARSYTFAVACKLLVGVHDPEIVQKLLVPFRVIVLGLYSLPIDLPGTRLNGAVKASKIIKKQLLQIISERKAELLSHTTKCNDILYNMLTTADENGRFWSEAEIAESIMGLLIAGYDTASATITFILKVLAEMPHIYDAVFKEQSKISMTMQPGQLLKWEDLNEMTYSWNVANETMRLWSPGQGNFREAMKDFNYAGFSIPKGYKVYWNVNTTHKNPEYFVEPEKFDPTRFQGSGPIPYSFTPFGAGPRMCPGSEYARLEILVFLHHVVTRFKWESLIPDEKIIVAGTPKPEHGLLIRLYPHKYSNN